MSEDGTTGLNFEMETMMYHTKSRKWGVALLVATIVVCVLAADVFAARVKDLATVKGVRSNQLIGYGLVVGLAGTGDGKQAGFTGQSLANMMSNIGVQLKKDDVNVKNVASVMITAQLPPFMKVGQTIDVILSSMGDASSLAGGTLLPTTIKGLDGKVYGMAQGPVSIGGFEIGGGDATRQKNHLTVARIPDGATVEREVPVLFAGKEELVLSLKSPDFTTVGRLVEQVNAFLGGPFAAAQDGGTVHVTVPENYHGSEVVLLAAIEGIEVEPDMPARVVLDERTGTVVMGENVRIGRIALSHGNLSLSVSALTEQARPNETPEATTGSRLVKLPDGASLGDVVRALNSMGVSPRDMIAIFQSIKAAGALQAELEII